jgi:predicted Zn-dependent protease
LRPEAARRALALALTVLSVTSCGTLSVQDEKELGHQYQRQIREQLTLMRDRVVVNYVRAVGAKLVEASPPSPFEFRFYVVEDDSLNAFAIPGGAIYIHSGIIQKSQNVAELAGVMAHEIGHVTSRHIAKRYSQRRGTGIVANVLAIAIAIVTGNPIAAQAGQAGVGIAATAYNASFTREDESEADDLAVRTLIKAGYDPDGLITMFQTLKGKEKGLRPPQFLLDHPATQDRIDHVSGQIRLQPSTQGLRKDDGGRLEIIQKRIELIVGTDPGSDS